MFKSIDSYMNSIGFPCASRGMFGSASSPAFPLMSFLGRRSDVEEDSGDGEDRAAICCSRRTAMAASFSSASSSVMKESAPSGKRTSYCIQE